MATCLEEELRPKVNLMVWDQGPMFAFGYPHQTGGVESVSSTHPSSEVRMKFQWFILLILASLTQIAGAPPPSPEQMARMNAEHEAHVAEVKAADQARVAAADIEAMTKAATDIVVARASLQVHLNQRVYEYDLEITEVLKGRDAQTLALRGFDELAVVSDWSFIDDERLFFLKRGELPGPCEFEAVDPDMQGMDCTPFVTTGLLLVDPVHANLPASPELRARVRKASSP